MLTAICSFLLLTYCFAAGILHEALNSVTTADALHMTNGADGRRRHAVYSKCLTPSNIHKHYVVCNEVSHSIQLYVG